MKKTIIRKALETECNALTEISFSSKQYWNYPKEYFDIWEKELTITAPYINENIVYAAEIEGKIIGYLSIVEVKKGFWAGKAFIMEGYWLDHFFIQPDYIGKGIGSELISFVKGICREKRIKCLYVFSDPNAKGFYNKIGAVYIGETSSSIEGRKLPLFKLEV